MFVRRRAVAVLLIAALAVGIGWALRRHWPGAVRTGSAAAHGARILHYDVRSRFTHRTLAQTAAIPAGRRTRAAPAAARVPARSRRARQRLELQRRLLRRARQARRAGAGRRLPRRRHGLLLAQAPRGDWGRYVLDEVIPQAIRRLHADPRARRDRRHLDGRLRRLRDRPPAPAGVLRRRRPLARDLAAGRRLRGGAFDDAAGLRRRRRPRARPLAGAPRGARRASGSTAATATRSRPAPTPSPRRSHQRAPLRGRPRHGYWHPHYARYLRFYANALAAC